jgi:uroporphyrinogen decarboxylase
MSGETKMNKVERVEAVFRNEKPDRIPAGFWFHYRHEWDTERMAAEHLKTWRETDGDIVKVMQDYVCKLDIPVKVPADWKNVRFPGVSSPVFQKLLDVLKRILDDVGGETLVFQTLFGPFKHAVMSYGDDLVMTHAREDPGALKAAVGGIAESLARWAAAFVEAGAAGLYYAAQFSEPGRFSRAVWEDLVMPGDLAVMGAAGERGGRNILHICGEPEYAFKTNPSWFTAYPAAIVNWSVKDNNLSLAEGKKLFARPILGGMNNKGNILNGSDEAIKAEAEHAIRNLSAEGLPPGFMLGADCTIQGEGIRHGKIRAAVDAAHGYK